VIFILNNLPKFENISKQVYFFKFICFQICIELRYINFEKIRKDKKNMPHLYLVGIFR
jgi:hypothetical protein